MDSLHLISGTVSDIVFRNQENGYTVLHLTDASGSELTVVGCMPGVAPGESLSIHGKWEHHSAYGDQLKAEIIERTFPVEEHALVEYLSSGVVKGIRAAMARRLVEAFGADVLTVIAENPNRVAKLRGITQGRALAMQSSLRLQLSLRLLMDFLSAHGLPLQIAMPLYQKFGDAALRMIQDNPYLLMNEPSSLPFPIADKLAESLAFSEDNPLRLEAGLLFELTHNLENGHVFLPRAKLLDASARLMNVDPATLPNQLDALLTRGTVVLDPIAGEDACYLAKLHTSECYVANQLLRMADNELLPPSNQTELIEKLQQDQGIVYAPLQIEAILTAAKRQLMLLTGGPGTGKTTSLRGVLALFDQLGFHTALVAPTGRAAKRLAETCNAEASTIHRLLETHYDPKHSTLVFSHNEQNTIDADAVIVDEVSMVDLPLMHALIAALPNDCRMILVGDPNQLPSVGPGNLLSDLLRSHRLPSLCLTEIFRQAASSTIIQNAYHVNHGEMPPLTNTADKDFFFLRRIDPNAALDTIVDLCLNRLPNKLSIPSDQIQVLSPTRRGITGTASLNRALQATLNPPALQKPERAFGLQLFRLGDRVMQIKNNYDLIWEDRTHNVSGMGVFNGDIGQITELDPKGGTLTIDFDGHFAEYPLDIWTQLEPAYAITVHKSQGSEYRAVILCVTDAAPMLLTRSVLYTAMTRAKELLILVGDEHIIARMTASDRQQRRYSGLRARLEERR